MQAHSAGTDGRGSGLAAAEDGVARGAAPARRRGSAGRRHHADHWGPRRQGESRLRCVCRSTLLPACRHSLYATRHGAWPVSAYPSSPALISHGCPCLCCRRRADAAAVLLRPVPCAQLAPRHPHLAPAPRPRLHLHVRASLTACSTGFCSGCKCTAHELWQAARRLFSNVQQALQPATLVTRHCRSHCLLREATSAPGTSAKGPNGPPVQADRGHVHATVYAGAGPRDGHAAAVHRVGRGVPRHGAVLFPWAQAASLWATWKQAGPCVQLAPCWELS